MNSNYFESEQAVIGSLLRIGDLSQDAAQKTLSMIKPSSFHDRRHKEIFESIIELDKESSGLDIFILDARINQRGHSELTGGLAYLIEIQQNILSAANIIGYADIVRQNSIKRVINSKMQNALAEFNDLDGETVYQKLGQLETVIATLGQRAVNGRESGLTHMKDIGKQWYNELNERKDNPELHAGLSTGIESLDSVLGAKLLVKGSLLVVGARPKMGKTAFLTKLAEHVGVELNKPTAIFSLEMPNLQIYERFLTGRSNVSGDAFHSVRLNENQWNRTSTAIGEYNKSKIHIDDTPSITLQYLKKECRKLAKKYHSENEEKLGIIAVDYLTLMTAAKADTNSLAYGMITKGLKELAKELDCVVMLLTQLNRNLEQRADKRPIPADSRDTGQIEQDCDYWVGLYRESVYDDQVSDAMKGYTEAIVRLNRHGGVGTGYMNMVDGCMRNQAPFSFEREKPQNNGKQF